MNHLKPIFVYIYGNSGQGKTTLGTLITDFYNPNSVSNCKYFGIDESIRFSLNKKNDPVIDEIYSRFEPPRDTTGKGIAPRIHIFSQLVSEECPEIFTELLYRDIIENLDHRPIMIIDGYTLSFENIRDSLTKRLKDNDYRVWDLHRL